MTVIADKLAEAGVKLPTNNFRVWHYLRDHPGKTLEQLSKAKVIENYGSLSSVLSQAVYREILTQKMEYDKRAGRPLMHFYANRDTFEEAMSKALPHKRPKPTPKQAVKPKAAERETVVISPQPAGDGVRIQTLSDFVTSADGTASELRPYQTQTIDELSESEDSGVWVSGVLSKTLTDDPETLAEDYVKTASLQQAKALYDKLHAFFKGSVA